MGSGYTIGFNTVIPNFVFSFCHFDFKWKWTDANGTVAKVSIDEDFPLSPTRTL